MTSESQSMNCRTRCQRLSSSSLEMYSLRSMTPPYEMQLIDLVHLETRKPRCVQLIPHLIQCVGSMQRSQKIALQNGRCILRQFIHVTFGRLRIRGTQQVDHQHRRTRLGASSGRLPEFLGIGEMVQETVANDRVESFSLESLIGQIAAVERD